MAENFFDRVSSKALGEMLIEKGALTASEVDQALELAKRDKLRLGEALVKLGLIAPDAIGYALAEQFGMRPMELHPSMIDARLISRFPMQLLLQHTMLPLIEVDKELVVVISDPNNRKGLEELQSLSEGLRISPHLGDEAQIRRCLSGVADTETAKRNFASDETQPAMYFAKPPDSDNARFSHWLVFIALKTPDRDLYLREIENEIQVALAPSQGDDSGQSNTGLTEIGRFKMDYPASARDRLLRRCTLVPETAGSVYVWNEPIQSKGQDYEMQVFSPNRHRGVLARLRLLAIRGDDGSNKKTQIAPNLAPGVCTVITYDENVSLENVMADFLEDSRRAHAILLSQQATRVVFHGIETVPDPFGEVKRVAKIMGATCVVYDHPVGADEIARLLTTLTPPPAILVFAPAAGKSVGLSPDIENILALPGTERLVMRADATTITTGEHQ